ncbi:hypothetical protein PARU111607_07860 [Palleronia rufa]
MLVSNSDSGPDPSMVALSAGRPGRSIRLAMMPSGPSSTLTSICNSREPLSKLPAMRNVPVSASRRSAVMSTAPLPSARLADPSKLSSAASPITGWPSSIRCAEIRPISIATGRSGRENGCASGVGALVLAWPRGRRGITISSAVSSCTSRRPRSSARRFQSRTAPFTVSHGPSASEISICAIVARLDNAPSNPRTRTCVPSVDSRSSIRFSRNPPPSSAVSWAMTGMAPRPAARTAIRMRFRMFTPQNAWPMPI